MIRRFLIRALLGVLNSQWLNHTPCRYEFVGNVDAFSREDIESTLRHNPDMTLQEYINIANRFKFCPLSRSGITVIEEDGTYSMERDLR